jgi:GTP-binding protein
MPRTPISAPHVPIVGEEPFTASEIEAGERLFSRPFQFLKSAPALEYLPPADRPEIAFAGRSNVGKSSLINALVRHRGLARTSNTPGRTQELNYFLTEAAPLYFVDMPGYGFADAPRHLVADWLALVKDYLRGRPTLARVFVLVDSRHGIKPVDREIFSLLNVAAVSFSVVLTKIDKLSAHAVAESHAKVRDAIAKEAAAHPRVIATSSETGAGIPQLRAEVAIAIGLPTG